jgi:outer membrane protein assembly factor BamB
VVWQTPLDRVTLNAPDLVIHGSLVLVATNSSKLACFDYMTGALLWTAPLGEVNVVAPQPRIVVHDEHVFVEGHGALECITLQGQHRWRVKVPEAGSGGNSFGFPGHTRRAGDKPNGH